MAPHEGLVHMKEYDWRDSNVENIGTELDHKVKYNSAATEPAWQEVGNAPGLYIWRIEDFEVVPWPREQYGDFHEGDSYIVLHSYKVGSKDGQEKLAHDIFFWLGSKTTQDEAGTAAYKTVELDEFLHGVAIQHRELQKEPSDDFVALFSRIRILSGGVRSGFTHVETDEESKETLTLLRIFKHPTAKRADSVLIYEVEPTWQSLDENDVFVLERNNKIWVWQGKNCSPMEKAKAAQVVHDMTIAKHIDVEVIAQAESRSRTIVTMLGGEDVEGPFQSPRPIISSKSQEAANHRPRKLFRLSDASGELRFNAVRDSAINSSDLDSDDVFLLDTGSTIWVWQGSGASRTEKAMWIKVAESYIRRLGEESGDSKAYLTPISKVVEGSESPAFIEAINA
ncbi:Severin [Daldinia childiae]|uniref:Severin n=1 Tax=Daldinia childiae TaxID=326645 RepID=UPI001448877D|nr:Severin [Daldinia childiae]KAF3059562.1 Severin [Daldinia childiae]